eukprot:g24953.t1
MYLSNVADSYLSSEQPSQFKGDQGYATNTGLTSNIPPHERIKKNNNIIEQNSYLLLLQAVLSRELGFHSHRGWLASGQCVADCPISWHDLLGRSYL